MYKHLTPYKRPSNYIGAEWPGYYDVAGRNRASDTLTESNHACWLKFLTDLLGPADELWAICAAAQTETVTVLISEG